MAKVQHDHVDHPLERLMFFSDAVFAIAITLLVIEIDIPHLTSSVPEASWIALRNLFPSFGAYVLSFAVIGRFWMAHHSYLGMMERHVPKIMWPNLILLICVAFMPFSTAYFAANLHNPAPVQFYNMILLALAIASFWVSWIASARENVRQSVTDEQRQEVRGRGLGVTLVVAITLGASYFIGQGFGQLFLAFMPLSQRLMIGVFKKRYVEKA